MNDLAATAARNNALWCHAICRVNGRPGEFYNGLWLNRHGTPRFYPDAVSLASDPGLVDVLASLVETDPSRGWAVKDSFATMDLSPLGFETLFDAQWLFLEPPEAGRMPDDVVIIDNDSDLKAWTEAWAGPESSGDAGPFRLELLNDSDIAFALLRQGRMIVGGGILNRGAGVVGLSNLFSSSADHADAVWQGMTALAVRHCPGRPLVGYERGADLAAARRNGFRPVGDLKVWHRPGNA